MKVQNRITVNYNGRKGEFGKIIRRNEPVEYLRAAWFKVDSANACSARISLTCWFYLHHRRLSFLPVVPPPPVPPHLWHLQRPVEPSDVSSLSSFAVTLACVRQAAAPFFSVCAELKFFSRQVYPLFFFFFLLFVSLMSHRSHTSSFFSATSLSWITSLHFNASLWSRMQMQGRKRFSQEEAV